MLEPDKKTYTIITEADASKEHIKIAEGLLPVGSSTVTSEGKTETIAGHRCQYWQFGNGMQLCLAQGLGDRYESTPAGTKTAGWASKQKEMLDANPEYAKFIKGGAYPLKVINIVNGEPVVLSEVTRVERQALDDSLFTVPAGYTKEKAPTKEDFQATMKELESLTNGVDSQRGELRKDLDSQRKALEKELDALKKGPHSPRKAPLGK